MVGGAGSGKSHFAAEKVLGRLVSEQGPHRFVVGRKVQRTLRASCFRLLNDYINRWGWTKHFNVNKSDLDITFMPTGAQIMFVGMDDPEKLKSIEQPTGFWLEEATEFSEEDIGQVNLRLRTDIVPYMQIMLTFNPISINHHLKTRFFDCEPTERITTMRSTFLDNPFLVASYRAELEDLRLRNPSWWTIYGRGEWGVMEGLIYDPPIIGLWPESFDETFYGLDFGYNNPTALIQVDIKDKVPYLTELVYETELTNAGLIKQLTGSEAEGLIKPLITNRNLPIYADAAEPGRIVEIRNAGFNCKPADKGPGSVHAGISFCKGVKLYTKSSNANLNAEFSSYVWLKDKNGKTLDEPIAVKNHAMDAMRYGLWTHLGKRRPLQPIRVR